MLLLLLAAAGFFALFLSDFLRLRGRPSGLLSAAGYLLVTGSISAFILLGGRPDDSFRLSALLGSAIILVSGALLVYSVFIEIPFARKKTGADGDSAIMSGTYGFSRHPGFLWFAALQAGIVLLRGGGAAPFAICLIALDFLLVLGQDRIFFPKFFKNYAEYKTRVPFLLRLW